MTLLKQCHCHLYHPQAYHTDYLSLPYRFMICNHYVSPWIICTGGSRGCCCNYHKQIHEYVTNWMTKLSFVQLSRWRVAFLKSKRSFDIQVGDAIFVHQSLRASNLWSGYRIYTALGCHTRAHLSDNVQLALCKGMFCTMSRSESPIYIYMKCCFVVIYRPR